MNRNGVIYELAALDIGTFCSQDIGTKALELASCIV